MQNSGTFQVNMNVGTVLTIPMTIDSMDSVDDSMYLTADSG